MRAPTPEVCNRRARGNTARGGPTHAVSRTRLARMAGGRRLTRHPGVVARPQTLSMPCGHARAAAPTAAPPLPRRRPPDALAPRPSAGHTAAARSDPARSGRGGAGAQAHSYLSEIQRESIRVVQLESDVSAHNTAGRQALQLAFQHLQAAGARVAAAWQCETHTLRGHALRHGCRLPLERAHERLFLIPQHRLDCCLPPNIVAHQTAAHQSTPSRSPPRACFGGCTWGGDGVLGAASPACRRRHPRSQRSPAVAPACGRTAPPAPVCART